MRRELCRMILFIVLLFPITKAFSQQDVTFHLNTHLFSGKKILKVKRDFHDPYVWLLAENNEVYRVNSLTMAIDNYTPVFSVYNNLRFIDIAGRSKDTVFIATASKHLIQFKNANVKLVNIKDTLTSVGIDGTNRPYRLSFFDSAIPTLLIGTTRGMRRYIIDAETDSLSSDPVYSQIFESTYRRNQFSGISIDFLPDTIQYFSVECDANTIYIQQLWLGGKSFGTHLNTTFYTTGTVYNTPNDVGNVYWGTEKGLFQSSSSETRNLAWPHKHYLDNTPVTKITDIFGLTNFGNLAFTMGGLVKENLLIGTKQGLYFSSSVYGHYSNGLGLFSLFHDDDLGSVNINDICVNPVSTRLPFICEDGVWVAADDGLYLLKPDYSGSINQSQMHLINFQNQTDTISTTTVCSGDSVIATVNPAYYSAASIQWYKNGAILSGQTKNTLTIGATGEYYAILNDPCQQISLESNHLAVSVTNGPVFSFNYPDKVQHCNSMPDTLKTDNNPAYHYRWYTNGVLNGNTTSQFIVTQSGKYKVELSACTNSWTSSKEIEVDLITLPVPAINSDKSIYCAGDEATLTVNTPLDTSRYSINWSQDGKLLPQFKNQTTIKTSQAGNYTVVLASTISNCTQSSHTKQLAFTPAPTFAFTYPDKLTYCDGTPVTLKATASTMYHYRWYKDNVLTGDTLSVLNIIKAGSYKIEASACAGSWVPSKTVQVVFIKVPTPAIKPDKPAYCIGDNATLSVNVSLDTAYAIEWYLNNTLITADKNVTSVTTTTPGNYLVTVTSNQLNCSQSSAAQSLVFNPPPTVAIQKIIKTTLCDGQTVDLKVNYTGGTVQWSTGQSSDQIGVTTSGTYKATVTSAAGCIADTNIDVQFLSNPVLSVRDTSVCTFTRQTVILTAPPGFASYSWNNGISSDQTYSVTTPQTVSLTVTDANGCQSTQQIVIANQCPEVHIPNTFTPNGDGMNDWWVIGGLENDATASVRVYNRYGNLLYESKGYGSPWDGTYKGSKLPPGVYYYTINAKNNKQKFSGSVTIIY